MTDTPALGEALPDGTPVPEKFRGKSVADVLKSYGELESSRNQTQPPPAPPASQNVLEIPKPAAGADSAQWAREIATTGTLSAASRDAVKRARPGTTDAEIDTQINGIRAIQTQAQSAAFEVAGGKEGYAAMMNWAGQNLTAEQQSAYNSAANHPDPNVRDLAVRGLHAQFAATPAGQQTAAASLTAPNLVSANPGTGSSNAQAYATVEEFRAAQATPEYHNDPRYREEAMAKYAAAQRAGVKGFA